MFRKTSGAILCPSCGRLTNADAPVCLVCGRRNPGMWGFGGPLGTLLRRWNFTNAVTAVCVALYVISLIFDPLAALRPRGILEVFSPSADALWALGAAGAIPWHYGRWWTLLTAIYLHGGILHIFFNVMWIRNLGPAVIEAYGQARAFVIFSIAGAVGFLLSNIVTGHESIGASGSIFGLMSALIVYGRQRGHVAMTRQLWQWAIIVFAMGFFMRGVNNWAHLGGFAGGWVAALAMRGSEHREGRGVQPRHTAQLVCSGRLLDQGRENGPGMLAELGRLALRRFDPERLEHIGHAC